ncbi:MAG: hypothetical protein C4K48_10520 [Candidatus Thorarchaeota archaeon]|nr:MAG: hypothetical protein C4K48_10520 [Candidatus Thorarchaeota archaeon]
MNIFIIPEATPKTHGEYSLRLKPVTILMLLVVIDLAMPVSVIGQSNNSLEWGVGVGEEFTYVLQKAYVGDPSYLAVAGGSLPFISGFVVGEKMTMRITQIESIPSLINESTQMPLAHCDFERASDSVAISTGRTEFAVPIGDWDFLTGIANITGLEGVTLVNTEDEWGTISIGSFQTADESVISYHFESLYEKQNGTLNYFRQQYAVLGTDLIDVVLVNWHAGMPTVIGTEIQLTTILIIAIGAIVGLVVAFMVVRGYRNKKPIVRRLGE